MHGNRGRCKGSGIPSRQRSLGGKALVPDLDLRQYVERSISNWQINNSKWQMTCELPRCADCNDLILGSPGSGNSENTSLGSHHPKKL